MASNSASRGPEVIVISIVFTILALFFVVTRFLARAIILKSVGRDELAILGSMLCAIALLVATLEQTRYGLGRHFSAVSTAEFDEVLKCLWVAILFYNISLTLTKTSIVLQYLRVFVGFRIRCTCWIAIGFITIYGLGAIGTAIWTCTPISAFWDANPNARCINKKFIWFFNAAMNILTDLIILILPMPVLSALKLPSKQKIGLMLIFAVGGFVCLVSILRLHALYVVSISDDITWDNTDAAIWSIIEVDTGIICASLPTIKPVVSRLFPRLLSSNRSTNPTHPSHNYPTSGFHSSTPYSDPFNRAAIRLDDVESPPHQTAVKIEASERHVENGTRPKPTDENRKDIFVTTSINLDVESKSEMGSEKDLIFQR